MFNGVSCLLSDFKLDRRLCFLLHDHCPTRHSTAMGDIRYADLYQITGSQLAINGKIKQCNIAMAFINLQPNPNSPNFLQFQWRLLTDEFAFVPWWSWLVFNELVHLDSPNVSWRTIVWKVSPVNDRGRLEPCGFSLIFAGDLSEAGRKAMEVRIVNTVAQCPNRKR